MRKPLRIVRAPAVAALLTTCLLVSGADARRGAPPPSRTVPVATLASVRVLELEAPDVDLLLEEDAALAATGNKVLHSPRRSRWTSGPRRTARGRRSRMARGSGASASTRPEQPI